MAAKAAESRLRLACEFEISTQRVRLSRTSHGALSKMLKGETLGEKGFDTCFHQIFDRRALLCVTVCCALPP